MFRGTKLNKAIKGLNFSTLSKTLVGLYQQARGVVKLGLREHKILLHNSRRARKWTLFKTHDELSKVFIKYSHSSPGDFAVKGKKDKEEIAETLPELQIKGGPRRLAIENIKLKRELGAQQGQFAKMLKMYTGAREMAKVLKSKDGRAMDLHWDLLKLQFNAMVHLWRVN